MKVCHLFLLLLLGGCSLPHLHSFNDPLSAEEHLHLGMAYEEQSQYDLAIQEYRTAAADRPMALLYLGNVHFQAGDTAAAEEYYLQALEELPDNPRPYNNLAWLYYTENRELEKAEELAVKAVELAAPGKASDYRDTLNHIRARNSARPGKQDR